MDCEQYPYSPASPLGGSPRRPQPTSPRGQDHPWYQDRPSQGLGSTSHKHDSLASPAFHSPLLQSPATSFNDFRPRVAQAASAPSADGTPLVSPTRALLSPRSPQWTSPAAGNTASFASTSPNRAETPHADRYTDAREASQEFSEMEMYLPPGYKPPVQWRDVPYPRHDAHLELHMHPEAAFHENGSNPNPHRADEWRRREHLLQALQPALESAPFYQNSEAAPNQSSVWPTHEEHHYPETAAPYVRRGSAAQSMRSVVHPYGHDFIDQYLPNPAARRANLSSTTIATPLSRSVTDGKDTRREVSGFERDAEHANFEGNGSHGEAWQSRAPPDAWGYRGENGLVPPSVSDALSKATDASQHCVASGLYPPTPGSSSPRSTNSKRLENDNIEPVRHLQTHQQVTHAWSSDARSRPHDAKLRSDQAELRERSRPALAYVPPREDQAIARSKSQDSRTGKSGSKAGKDGPPKAKKSKRFWAIIVALMVVTVLTAIDLSILAPALPTVVAELPPSNIPSTWITSSFLLTVTAFQPLMGGLADVLGRRNSLVLSVVLFTAGSIFCALAPTLLLLVAGRGIQGVGGGGIQAVAEIILSDLTTLRERGTYVGLISLVYAVSTFLAPVLGGVFAATNWRWIFWINVPLGVISLIIIIPSMKLRTQPLPMATKIKRMDIPANLILLGASIALLYGATNGGVQYPWSDWRIYVPLVCGASGLVLFAGLEFLPNPIAPEPVLPPKLFNRTAGCCFVMALLHGIVLYGSIYMYPIYFQALYDSSPLKSAVQTFALTAVSAPAAIISGIIMAATGKYKLQILINWAMAIAGFSLTLLWKLRTPTWEWIIIQLLAGYPLGSLFTLTLPPVQSSLPVSDLAQATATYVFMRSLGSVFGISLSTAIFTACIEPLLKNISGVKELGLSGSTSIAFATELRKLPEQIQTPVRQAYLQAFLRSVLLFIPVSGLGFFIALFVRPLPLPDFNNSEHGIVGEEGQNHPLLNAAPEEKAHTTSTEKRRSLRRPTDLGIAMPAVESRYGTGQSMERNHSRTTSTGAALTHARRRTAGRIAAADAGSPPSHMYHTPSTPSSAQFQSTLPSADDLQGMRMTHAPSGTFVDDYDVYQHGRGPWSAAGFAGVGAGGSTGGSRAGSVFEGSRAL